VLHNQCHIKTTKYRKVTVDQHCLVTAANNNMFKKGAEKFTPEQAMKAQRESKGT
jgi:hypothetical protein